MDLTRMAEWIDATVALRAGIPQWPGDPLLSITRACDMARGDEANVTALSICAHTGTHVDAPLHYVEGGAAVGAIPINCLIGPVRVQWLSEFVPAGDRMLFRTRASGREWWNEPFTEDFDSLNPEQARLLVASGVKTVGIDYLSIGDAETHRVLLSAGVCVIEGLDLSKAVPGEYEMICLPLKIADADGAPARVVLRPLQKPL